MAFRRAVKTSVGLAIEFSCLGHSAERTGKLPQVENPLGWRKIHASLAVDLMSTIHLGILTNIELLHATPLRIRV